MLNPSGGNVGVNVFPAHPFEVKTATDSLLRVVASGATARSYIQSTNAARSAYTKLLMGGISVEFEVNGTSRWEFSTGAHFLPIANNTYNIGSASFAVKDGWIVNAWTVTSTRLAKTLERGATEAERRAAARIKARGPRFYKMIDAVEEKGDTARWHVGYVAEDTSTSLPGRRRSPRSYWASA